ncbi:hypothetical protein [Amycolatopsis sp.]|uniref:hypothetical protein n=1 Tax=Amycolatopsis sp. TaxID=37632 RepID=UPI002B5B9A6A|nr:hypothetical protein [Amycolatopsis sp.]HVV11595.1 hypothetical protein [Amycolatopsis sp.]
MAEYDALAVARGVAMDLGDGWEAQPGYWSNGEDARITGPNGAGLHLRLVDAWKASGERLEISGSLDRELSDRLPYNEKSSFKITVTPDKAPARIAGDIRRRLLPDYLPTLAFARARKAEHDRAEQEKGERLDGLAANLPDAKRGGLERGSVLFGGGLYGNGTVRGEVKESYDGGTEWMVRVQNREDALALAAFLSKLARKA